MRRPAVLASFALSALGILPFLIAFIFIRPSYDDAAFYLETTTRGLPGALEFWYRAFSGRYSSNAFVSILSLSIPFVWLYRLCCLLIFLAFIASVYRVIRALLALARDETAALSGLVVVTFLVMTPSASEGLYWLTGTATYTLGSAFLLFAIERMVTARSARPAGAGTWGAAAWIVLAVGMNEVALLMLNGFLAFLIVRELIDTHRVSRRSLIWMGTSLAASLAAVLAPGNFTRLEFAQSLVTTSGSARTALVTATKAVVLDTYYLMHASPLLALLLLAAALEQQRTQAAPVRWLRESLAIPWFGVVLFGVIAFFAYAQGFHPIPRVMNPVYFGMILFAAIVVVRALAMHASPSGLPALVVALASVAFAGGLLRSGSGVRTAYAELLSGSWQRYERDLSAREAFVAQRRGQHVLVPEIAERPSTLFVFDIGADPTQRHNAIYAYFYGVRSIATRPSSAGARAPFPLESAPRTP